MSNFLQVARSAAAQPRYDHFDRANSGASAAHHVQPRPCSITTRCAKQLDAPQHIIEAGPEYRAARLPEKYPAGCARAVLLNPVGIATQQAIDHIISTVCR